MIETNHDYRKNVFDHFIEKTELVKLVIEKRFNTIRDIMKHDEMARFKSVFKRLTGRKLYNISTDQENVLLINQLVNF